MSRETAGFKGDLHHPELVRHPMLRNSAPTATEESQHDGTHSSGPVVARIQAEVVAPTPPRQTTAPRRSGWPTIPCWRRSDASCGIEQYQPKTLITEHLTTECAALVPFGRPGGGIPPGRARSIRPDKKSTNGHVASAAGRGTWASRSRRGRLRPWNSFWPSVRASSSSSMLSCDWSTRFAPWAI